MQPLKITIFGDFWDCQLYRGRLYLWLVDGSLKTYDWDEILNCLIGGGEDEIVFRCGFTNGSYLYGQHLQLVFSDNDFRSLLFKKFKKAEQKNLEVSAEILAQNLLSEQNNPFKDLPTDTEVFSNKIYAITHDGLFSSVAHRAKSEKNLVGVKTTKYWDCPLLSIKADKYAKIALSGGSEGLFQYDAKQASFFDTFHNGKNVESRINQISDKHSLFANWASLSLYNSSNVDEDYMALFMWRKNEISEGKSEKFNLQLTDIISEKSIFNTNNIKGLSWGSKNKIYRADNGRVDIVDFNNYAKDDESFFSETKSINIKPWKGEVIGGGTAYFGTIIECENALIVALSNGETYTINGSATRWRVYPRSINYENHLHVILDDRIEIYSFNHDYFVDQNKKDFGLIYSEKVKFRRK